jgi:hypothetical protein
MNATPVRPKPLTDIIAEAFSLCARSWRPFGAVALVAAVPLLLVQLGIVLGADAVGLSNLKIDSTPTTSQGFFLAGALVLLVAVVFICISVLVPVTFDAALGQKPRARLALRSLPALLPSIVTAGVILAVSLTLLLESVILSPIALFLIVRWSFAPQTLWRSKRGGVTALRESFHLVSGKWLHVALFMGAVALLATLPGFVLRPIASVSGSLPVIVAIGILTWLLAGPFLAQAGTLIYLDTLSRKGERLLPPAPTPPSATEDEE